MSRRTDYPSHGSSTRREWTVLYLTTISVAVAVVGCHDPSDPTLTVSTGDHATPAVGLAGLTAPSNTSAASVSSTQINVSWTDESQKETGFEVQRSIGPSGTFTPVATAAANTATYRDQALVALTQYCYRIRAVRANPGNIAFSAFSNTACATTLPPPPPPASNTTIAVSISGSVTVTWSDNSPREDGFRIQESVDGNLWTLAATVGINTTSWVTNRAVCYRVIAFNAGGEASPSNVACAIPGSASAVRSIPSSPTSTTVSWADNSPNEAGFRVYRFDNGTIWSLAATVGANVTSWVTDQPVCYRVIAFNAYGEAPPSNVGCTLPAYVEATAVESSATSVVVSWLDYSTNEDGFRIYRSPDGVAGWSLVTTVAANTASWETSQVLCYRVVAFNAAGDGPSNVACTTPAAPTNVMVNNVGDTFQLTWTDNSAIEDGYLVIEIVDTWCPRGSTACNAGGTEPQFAESILAALPANSTSLMPVPNLSVASSLTECACIFVVATKDWAAGSVRSAQRRRIERQFFLQSPR